MASRDSQERDTVLADRCRVWLAASHVCEPFQPVPRLYLLAFCGAIPQARATGRSASHRNLWHICGSSRVSRAFSLRPHLRSKVKQSWMPAALVARYATGNGCDDLTPFLSCRFSVIAQLVNEQRPHRILVPVVSARRFGNFGQQHLDCFLPSRARRPATGRHTVGSARRGAGCGCGGSLAGRFCRLYCRRNPQFLPVARWPAGCAEEKPRSGMSGAAPCWLRAGGGARSLGNRTSGLLGAPPMS